MNDNVLSNTEYTEYLRLVTDAVAKHGIDEGDDLSKLVDNESVKNIFVKSYLEKCTPNQAAVMIQLHWDQVND